MLIVAGAVPCPLLVPLAMCHRFDASFLSLRAKSIMAKTALPMLTLVNTLIQVRGRSQFQAGWFSVAVMRATTAAP